jgi:hypothetical protein
VMEVRQTVKREFSSVGTSVTAVPCHSFHLLHVMIQVKCRSPQRFSSTI